MKYRGVESRRVSPYVSELAEAQCIKRLANFLGTLQITSPPADAKEVDLENADLLKLLADTEAVREEFYASSDDMQAALVANDPLLEIDGYFKSETRNELK